MDWNGLFGVVFLIVVGGGGFIIPTAVAFGRGHPSRWQIAVLNVALGGTGVFWVVALIWALQPMDPAERADAPTPTPVVPSGSTRTIVHQIGAFYAYRMDVHNAAGDLIDFFEFNAPDKLRYRLKITDRDLINSQMERK